MMFDYPFIIDFKTRYPTSYSNLEVNWENGTHCALQVQNLNVLPPTLKKRDQKVDRELHITAEFVFCHGDVSHSKIQAENLFHGIFDRACHFVYVVKGIVARRNTGRELALAVETRQKTGHTLDQSIGSHESIVLVSDLLELGLFLLQGLELVLRDVRQTFFPSFFTHFDVLCIGNNADLGVRLWRKWKAVCATEALVLCWAKIFDRDLKLDRL